MPTIACPYCNAPIPVSESPAGPVTCPRCGEAVRTGTNQSNGAAPRTGPGIIARADSPLGRPSNRAVGRIIVGVMLFMATVALVFALRTTEQRRANGYKSAKEPAAETAAEMGSLPPAEWPGLGYLPADMQALAGLHVARALESAAGRTLLGELFVTDPGKARILGQTPADIDRIMIGANHRTFPPQVIGVIRTGPAMDSEWTRQAMAANRTMDQHGKTLLRGRLWATGPDGAIWFADRHTLVAAVLPEDFDRIPATPQASSPLRDLLGRVDPAALAWIVASGEAINAALRYAGVPPPADPGNEPDALVMSLRADGMILTLQGQFHCRNATDEQGLARLMESMRNAGLTVERTASGEWQTLTVTADAEKLAKWLARRRGAARK
jgi:hypothetical protein